MSEDREIEVKRYSQTWFWQENEKSKLLEKLLKRIYVLEDEVDKLKQEKNKLKN